jgi:hypothetical protein
LPWSIINPNLDSVNASVLSPSDASNQHLARWGSGVGARHINA